MKQRFNVVLFLSFALSAPLYAYSDATQTQPLLQKEKVHALIDLNKADLAQLTGSFKGIGKKRAEAIIAYRASHRGFKSIDELADVKGIGPHFIEVNGEKLKETYTVIK